MLTEGLVGLFFGLFRILFGALEVVNLPTQFINTLSTILCYGIWIVGVDIMALFVGTVVFWWGVQMSIGLAVWVWERLPLT